MPFRLWICRGENHGAQSIIKWRVWPSSTRDSRCFTSKRRDVKGLTNAVPVLQRQNVAATPARSSFLEFGPSAQTPRSVARHYRLSPASLLWQSDDLVNDASMSVG